MTEGQRNILIVLVIAGVALAVPSVGSGIGTINLLVSIAFLVLITLWLWQSFQRHRYTISKMQPVHRFVLLASAVGLYMLFVFGLPPVNLAAGRGYAFMGLIAACAFGMYWSWTNRHR